MKRFLASCIAILCVLAAVAQGAVKGKVLDKKSDEPLEFINVTVSHQGQTKILKGAITDVEGKFNISGLANGNYVLTVSFTGYKDVKRQFTINDQNNNRNFSAIYLAEDSKTLDEVTVVGQRSEMKLEVDRKTFDVSQQIANAGQSASEVLENIPSVEVDNDGNVSLRGNSSVEVWVNGKASGLTADNRAQILQQLPAESIERIEVIDNPSAKFSAEGAAGIINIVLKKDRKAGYYGSIQAGGDTRKGANTSFNINYNSSLVDAYLNVGYRHRANKGRSESEQEYLQTNKYQWYKSENNRRGNNLFSRAGLTFHLSKKDDLGFSGMMMYGGGNSESNTPYHNGTIGAPQDTYIQMRRNTSRDRMRMLHGEMTYRHNFTEKHFLDFTASYNKWKSDNDNWYQDRIEYNDNLNENDNSPLSPSPQESFQYRPMHVNNRNWEVKLDYENPITEHMKLQAGYNGQFSHEDTPQESYVDNNNWDGRDQQEDRDYYNRFIYNMFLHAGYATLQYNFGKFGLMAGLKGEFWHVNTESHDWEQDHQTGIAQQASPFKKDFFKLFPSVFMSYQLTKNDQLQLNYTRRLRRPWGGELNSFKNTRDASMVSFGNPELTPEYSNSFSLNYLRTWTEHSLLVSAYYRPTSGVIQRINYQSTADGKMYQTPMNVASSQSSGVEMTLKNRLFRKLDLTSNVNAYYYNLDSYSFEMPAANGTTQTVSGNGNHSFSWNARVTASVILPYDISIQTSGRYRSRRAMAQGYSKAGYGMDFGIRKNFFNKKLTASLNCRDVLNSRKWENFTSSDTFTRHQMNKRGSRSLNLTLTWNFGNMKQKKRYDPNRPDEQQDDERSNSDSGGYSQGGEM